MTQKDSRASKKRHNENKEAVMSDMFDDMYKKRGRVYRVNFLRGVFFGLGSALGGTVIVAFILWLLSNFIDWPFISRITESLQK